MKILSIFFFVLLLAVLGTAINCFSFVHGDGANAKAEDFRCPLCRDFARRVVIENESPRKACRASATAHFNSCHFMLKETALISKLFDLRAEKSRRAVTEKDLRDVCSKKYTSMKNADDAFCPLRDDAFGSGRLGKLHADSAGWDIRVAPASSWMAPNTVRITVVDSVPTNHSAKFLSQFSFNSNFTLYATDKIVHTGIFPLTNPGGVSTVVLGDNEFSLPIKTASSGHPIRAVILADPCFSSPFVTCTYGIGWNILGRFTQLFNTLAKKPEALHLTGIIGDNFYDVTMETTPQWYNNLNAEALGTPFLTVPGNHLFSANGLCRKGAPQGIAPKGSTFAQYFGQNTYASSFINNANHSPFNFTGFNSSDAWTPAPLENFFFTTLVGNVGFIGFSGANTLEETMPYFVNACQWAKNTKMDFLFLLGHWSGVNCGCQPGMATHQVYDLLTTIDGCRQMGNKMKWIEGHSHKNIVVRESTGFRFGGAGMNDDPATFGVPYIDTFQNRLQIWNFHIAYANETGDEAWNLLMDCLNASSGLHDCTYLAELFLDQPVYP